MIITSLDFAVRPVSEGSLWIDSEFLQHFSNHENHESSDDFSFNGNLFPRLMLLFDRALLDGRILVSRHSFKY